MRSADLTRTYARVRALAAKAALSGGVPDGGVWVAPWVPACDAPVYVEHATPLRLKGPKGGPLRPVTVGMYVPCRRCTQCRRIRQMQWRERIQREISGHAYTYFVTLTFSPAHLAGVLAEASARKEATQRQRVEAAAYRHVSLWLKRLRKGRKARVARAQATETQGRVRQSFDPIELRFFAAHEYGEERGRLHYHLAVHTGRWVPPEVFTTEWRSRADASLVHSRDGFASYVSKYLTKGPDPARPRASLGYGQTGAPVPKRPTASSSEPLRSAKLDQGNASATATVPEFPGA